MVDVKKMRLYTQRQREKAKDYWQLDKYKYECAIFGCDYRSTRMQPLDYKKPVYCFSLCEDHFQQFITLWVRRASGKRELLDFNLPDDYKPPEKES